jgi:hypothetical protein
MDPGRFESFLRAKNRDRLPVVLTPEEARQMQMVPPWRLMALLLYGDPCSQKNLASSQNPAHQTAFVRLRQALDLWLVESNDQGRFPEPPEVTALSGYTRPESVPSKKGR